MMLMVLRRTSNKNRKPKNLKNWDKEKQEGRKNQSDTQRGLESNHRSFNGEKVLKIPFNRSEIETRQQ